MPVHNLISDRIEFVVPNRTRFDLELRGNLVVVNGFSGTGKTFFFTSLRQACLSGSQELVKGLDLRRVVFLNAESKWSRSLLDGLEDLGGKFILIDNADYLLDAETARYIGWDTSNQYLIFSRSLLPFDLSPNYYARMQKSSGLHTLMYPYEVAGWR